MEGNQLAKQEIDKLSSLINQSSIPEGLKARANQMVGQLFLSQETGDFPDNFEKVKKYIDWIASLPWQKSSQDQLDLNRAKEIFEKNHYGLKEIKERILEYLSVLILQQQRGEKEIRAPIFCFVGLVGTGKTTMAKSIAQALGRKFIRIPFGGLGDPLYLRGQSRLYPGAEPGQVIKGLRQGGTNNPVVLLDEIDRVADDALNTIMGVLVELLDPEQNHNFVDHFIDYPFDLSRILFVATANNTRRIATAVLDRIEPIQMPSYTDEEKITIGKSYLLPQVMEESGLEKEELSIADSCWPQIVRPLGYDAGLRTLRRTIEAICRQAARMIVEKKGTSFQITPENIKQFLPQW